MPIKPENAARYPNDWPQIRQRLLLRSNGCCEKCGVPNHELGGRRKNGTWLKAQPLGEKMLRLEWPRPGDQALCGSGDGAEVLRIVRIVLTIAHLDHTPENCADENLRAWCQRCHLAYDHEHHQRNAYQSRREGKAVDMFEGEI